MLPMSCSSCGAPGHASVASPELFRCHACGYHGAPPPEISRRLLAARELLAGLDVRLRQLSDAQKKTLTSSAKQRRIYRRLTIFLFIPFAIWGAGGIGAFVSPHDPFSDFGIGGLFLTLGPLVLFVAFAVLMYGQIKKRQNRLEQSCLARPPRAAGEPAACHVCGGPLKTETKAIVRCAFCEADNLVDPTRLAVQTSAEHRGVRDLELEIEAQARASAGEAGLGTASLALMVLGAPLLVLVLIFFVGIPLSFIEVEPSPKLRYSHVPVGATTCLARVRRDGKDYLLDFGKTPPEGHQTKEVIPEDPLPEMVEIQALMGLRVRRADGEVGRVVRVFQSFALPNDNQVEISPSDEAGGASESREVRGLCLAD